MAQTSRTAIINAAAPSGAGRTALVPVWDAPIRLFHWSIVTLVFVSWLSVENGWMRIHLISGYIVLSTLLFRMVWGFVGSDTARFSAFLSSPLSALRHLRRFTRREADTQIGHNAAGGWMVFVLLALLAVQTGTGLFANTFDDYDVNGPFAALVSRTDSDWLSAVHATNFDLILAAIALHVLAVAGYAVLKRQDLVRPMITGKKRLPDAAHAPRLKSSFMAAFIFACAAGVVAIMASRF